MNKEEYVAAVASGNLRRIPPRGLMPDEQKLSNEEVIVSRLKKIKTGYASRYTARNHKTGEKVTVEKFSGDTFQANTIVNRYKNFVEIVHYKKDFDCVMGRKEFIYNEAGEKILHERPRKFIKQGNDLIQNGVVDWDDVSHTNMKSAHRSLDNFYGYVQSNVWKYFVTFTFSPKKVKDRLDDNQIKYAFKKFRQKLQYLNPDVKMIVVPQRHKKNGIPAIHFHGFIGNVDLTKYLSLQRNKNNKPVKSKCGEQLYDLSLFGFGYNSVAILPDDYNEQRIANYCIRYITRDERIGYAQKAYYRTTNLEFKDKVVTYYSKSGFADLVNDIRVRVVKQTDKMVVYRKSI